MRVGAAEGQSRARFLPPTSQKLGLVDFARLRRRIGDGAIRPQGRGRVERSRNSLVVPASALTGIESATVSTKEKTPFLVPCIGQMSRTLPPPPPSPLSADSPRAPSALSNQPCR